MAGKATDDQLVDGYTTIRATATSQKYKMSVRVVQSRIRGIEGKRNVKLLSGTKPGGSMSLAPGISERAMVPYSITDGCILIAGDCHYWNHVTTAHRALVEFCREYKPKAVIMNGDVIDGARASRHPPIGWEGKPSMREELEYAKIRLNEIKNACPKGTTLFWPAGNHDLRFESLLARAVPEMEGIEGMHLKDHFKEWIPCWGVFVNDNAVVKHRSRNGLHAPHNNTVSSGRTIITNHLHSQKVMPWTDYNGTRWGVDTGCIAEPYSDPFLDYTEANAVNWRSGFCQATWVKGRLLQPELIRVCGDGEVDHRGAIHNV